MHLASAPGSFQAAGMGKNAAIPEKPGTPRKPGPASPSFRNERALVGEDCVCHAGVDEAGRGPWAGPVVAAAVIFEAGRAPKGLRDSKLLTADERARLYDAIRKVAIVGIGVIEVDDIDSLNILQATFRAMQQAVAQLSTQPSTVIVDGNLCPPLPCRGVPCVDGDQLCPSVAAASIIAKVTRDRMMLSLAQTFPGYRWETNKGYGTRDHADAIVKLGVTPHHRRSFAPIKLALDGRTSELAHYRVKTVPN
jgi:ribonuclease HII